MSLKPDTMMGVETLVVAFLVIIVSVGTVPVTDDNEVAALRGQIAQLQTQLNSLTGPPIAFSVQAGSSQHLTSAYERIRFERIITNIGGGYDHYGSIFRCPVKGIYHFDVTILSNANDRIETELIAAGVSRMMIYSGGGKYLGSGSNSVLLQLQAGDVVYVRLHIQFGKYVHHFWSTFNGHIVNRL